MRKTPSFWIVPHPVCGRLLLCLLSILVLSVVPAVAQGRGVVSPADEQEILQLVNAERRSRGLSTLVVDQGLVEAARGHSQLMASTGIVEHVVNDEPKLASRLGRYPLRFDASGENVAFSYSAQRAHTALMNSPGHRANILDGEYNAVGIGVIKTDQGIYVTQDFARRLPEVNVEQAEEQVGLQLNRMRRVVGIPELPRVAAPNLRARACEMADRDRLDPNAGLSPRVRDSVAFTAVDLSRIPESVQRLRNAPASGYSIGACYRTSRSYENPVFWFIVVTYF